MESPYLISARIARIRDELEALESAMRERIAGTISDDEEHDDAKCSLDFNFETIGDALCRLDPLEGADPEPCHVCKDCGGAMIGDGFTDPVRCEDFEPPADLCPEPDSGPWYCGARSKD